MFQPAFGCVQHPKAGRNTQQGTELWTGSQHPIREKRDNGELEKSAFIKALFHFTQLIIL